MIIKASQRGGAMEHARHLLKPENEHVEQYEIRGFVSDNVMGAMKEAQAVARGTKCKQEIFTASFNPPESETVPTNTFVSAIDGYEERLGLKNQPRIIVFHEKEGRRHAHCTWSRIKAETMTAVQMSHFKNKSQEISRNLFLEHGWKMPNGLISKHNRDPQNFTLAEWQQAKRMGSNAKETKASLQECWAISDSKAGFEQALKERGFYLARGDRRGHVAVTHEGEILSISRMIGKKTKLIQERLGDPNLLPNIDKTKMQITKDMTPVVQRCIQDHQAKHHSALKPLYDKRDAMTQAHRALRAQQDTAHRTRKQQEQSIRSKRFRTGFKGIWDRLTGSHAKLKKKNEQETSQSHARDIQERENLVSSQLKERQILQNNIKKERFRYTKAHRNLHSDIERYKRLSKPREMPARHNALTHER